MCGVVGVFNFSGAGEGDLGGNFSIGNIVKELEGFSYSLDRLMVAIIGMSRCGGTRLGYNQSYLNK